MRWLVAAALAACSQPAPAPVVTTPPPPAPANVPIDAPAVSQEEKLAAIQHAMNQLDEAAQTCWAAAATDRFDIEGEVSLMVEIEATSAKATVVTDRARNAKLSACLVKLLGGYRWAPPLYGDTIQLPFKFTAPDGQSVIDRSLVEWRGQSNISVAVLIDENNSANAAASMLEVAIAPQATTGMRIAERAELWYFPDVVEVKTSMMVNGRTMKQTVERIGQGGMMYVPRGAAREITPTRPDLRAVLVLVPGGREGIARAGALPTSNTGAGTAPITVMQKGAPYGPAEIFLDPTLVKGTPMSASILELAAGANVAEHVHAKETELLYILEGSGTMTIAGQQVAVTPTSVIQIPPNTKHAFTATAKVRALQVYTPAGPEQRFKAPPK